MAYIITDAERTAFRNLQSEAERQKFIEQFWERRDPIPGTIENEFKEEHYRRIGYANARFGSRTGIPGWKTDRGRIYIKYGPSDAIDSHPSTEEWRYRYIEGSATTSSSSSSIPMAAASSTCLAIPTHRRDSIMSLPQPQASKLEAPVSASVQLLVTRGTLFSP